MNKTWQYGILLAVIAAVIGATVWLAGNDLQRHRENGGANGIFFKDSKENHGNMISEENYGVNHYQTKQDNIMRDMMMKMEQVQASGNASIDFMTGMIPHHESAIAMADLYLASGGKNSSLKNVAENIKSAQTKEIAQMKDKIQKLKSAGEKDAAKAEAYRKNYQKMLAGHHTGHTFSVSSVDAAFAEGMIMHHQMAVDMAKGILDYTDDEEVKEMASSMITAQEQEIREMRKELKNS